MKGTLYSISATQGGSPERFTITNYINCSLVLSGRLTPLVWGTWGGGGGGSNSKTLFYKNCSLGSVKNLSNN